MNDQPFNPPLLRPRLFAFAYDLLALLGLWFLAGIIAVALTGGTLDPHQPAHRILVQALTTALCAGYYVVSWKRGGQTLGMRAWRLRIVRDDGGPLTWPQALLRLIVGCVSLAVLGAGFWWALFDAQRRTWHDRMAGTVVTRSGWSAVPAEIRKRRDGK